MWKVFQTIRTLSVISSPGWEASTKTFAKSTGSSGKEYTTLTVFKKYIDKTSVSFVLLLVWGMTGLSPKKRSFTPLLSQFQILTNFTFWMFACKKEHLAGKTWWCFWKMARILLQTLYLQYCTLVSFRLNWVSKKSSQVLKSLSFGG